MFVVGMMLASLLQHQPPLSRALLKPTQQIQSSSGALTNQLPKPTWQLICERDKRRPRCDELGFPFNKEWGSRRLNDLAIGNVSGKIVFDVGGNTGRDTMTFVKGEQRRFMSLKSCLRI